MCYPRGLGSWEALVHAGSSLIAVVAIIFCLCCSDLGSCDLMILEVLLSSYPLLILPAVILYPFCILITDNITY